MLKLTETNERLKEDVQKLNEELFLKDSKYCELEKQLKMYKKIKKKIN